VRARRAEAAWFEEELMAPVPEQAQAGEAVTLAVARKV
jgi:hypothetical protein